MTGSIPRSRSESTRAHRAKSRRRFLKTTAGAAAAVAVGMPRLSVQAQSGNMPGIPKKTITLATMPYTNHAWVVLMGRKGYLADVGITLDPVDPKVILEHQGVPQLQNGEIDMTTAYVGLITGAIDKLPDLKPIHVYSYWAGNAILTRPDSSIKTVDDFLAEGKPWPEAASLTMEQLKGKQITVPVDPSTYPWLNLVYGFAGLDMDASDVVRIDDPKAVQLGLAGRVPLAAPGGAVQIYQLQFQADWRVVMSTGQMVKYLDTSAGSEVNTVLNYDLIVSTQKFIDENRETVLRTSSAIYRTLDYIFGPDQNQALTEYAPFINANAGSNLDAAAIKYIFDVIDPFYRWNDQERIWTDRSYSLNYDNIYSYQLKKYREKGTIADRDYDLDDFFQAKNIWEELRDLKVKADGLMAKADGGNLSPERQEVVTAARQHYDRYNFLDAVRFLEAALV
ncbi:MAG: ABC transporter substrate-binding protein [Gammaproteobacteria bacterium]